MECNRFDVRTIRLWLLSEFAQNIFARNGRWGRSNKGGGAAEWRLCYESIIDRYPVYQLHSLLLIEIWNSFVVVDVVVCRRHLDWAVSPGRTCIVSQTSQQCIVPYVCFAWNIRHSVGCVATQFRRCVGDLTAVAMWCFSLHNCYTDSELSCRTKSIPRIQRIQFQFLHWECNNSFDMTNDKWNCIHEIDPNVSIVLYRCRRPVKSNMQFLSICMTCKCQGNRCATIFFLSQKYIFIFAFGDCFETKEIPSSLFIGNLKRNRIDIHCIMSRLQDERSTFAEWTEKKRIKYSPYSVVVVHWLEYYGN